jgi:hypothetical protein
MPRNTKRVNGRFVSDPERVDSVPKPDDNAGNVGGTTETVVATDIDPATVTGSAEPIGDDHRDGDLGGSGPEQPAKRGRGRPKGSGTKDKALPLNVKGIEKLLVGIHAGISVIASSPSFALDTESKDFDGKTESEFLSQSIADVARHYNPRVFDQKTMDWANLIQCLALLYLPRFYMLKEERRAARAKTVNPSPARPAGPRPVNPQANADRAANGHSTPVPTNEFRSAKEVFTGEIPGIGSVQLPDDWLGKPN